MKHLYPILLLVSIALLIGFSHTQFIGHPTSDMADHIWSHEWVWQTLRQGKLPLKTDTTHLPNGGSLWHIDPMGSLFFLPLRFFFNTIIAWNGMILCTLWIVSLFFFRTFRKHQLSPVGSFMGALSLSLSPYALGLIHSGLSEFLSILFPCIIVWKHHKTPFQHPLLMGGLVFLCFIQTPYYALCIGLYLLSTITRKEDIPKALQTIGIAAFLCVPLFWWIQNTFAASAAFTPQDAPGWNFRRLPEIDLLGWIHPGTWYAPDTPALGNPGILQIYYMGWIWIGIVAYTLWQSAEARLFFKRTCPFLILCLGPTLSINRLSTGIPLPMSLLYQFDLFENLHHPYRIVAIIIPILSVYAVYAYSVIPSNIFGWILCASLVETITCSPAVWPLHTTEQIAVPTISSSTAGNLLNWPPDASKVRRMALLAQFSHQKSIFMGINKNLPTTIYTDTRIRSLYTCLQNPQRLFRNRDIHQPPPLMSPTTDDTMLESLSVEWILFHRGILTTKEAQCTENKLKDICHHHSTTDSLILCTLH